MTSYVDVQRLTKNFGDNRAVDGISLVVSKGEILGFLGPNGAGKTTAMRMITGYITPSSGSVSICGHDIVTETLEAKKCLGYLPEGAPLYPDLSPRLFLDFMGRSRGMSKSEIKQRIDYIMDTLHLEPVFNQAIDTLSKGFKRRVGLAQAILHDPNVLILDEPTDGLDPIQKYEVHTLIKAMAKDKAIIISSHILEEVEAVCNRAVIIAKGSVQADGTPETLLTRHKHHNAVSLTLTGGDAESARESLVKLNGVSDVLLKQDGDNASLLVIPQDAQDIVHAVSHLIHDKRWRLISLSVERGKLDEVFRSIVMGDLQH
jgi:ABC-2 type transport system ATP-binding protein